MWLWECLLVFALCKGCVCGLWGYGQAETLASGQKKQQEACVVREEELTLLSRREDPSTPFFMLVS